MAADDRHRIKMTARSVTTADAARRLWVRVGGNGGTPAEVAAATEQLRAALRSGLGRWVGAEGYRALLQRAHRLAQVGHPSLEGLAGLSGEEIVTPAAVGARGVAEVTAGIVETMSVMIGLLGRIIGEEMAIGLMDQISIPSPRGVVRAQFNGDRDG